MSVKNGDLWGFVASGGKIDGCNGRIDEHVFAVSCAQEYVRLCGGKGKRLRRGRKAACHIGMARERDMRGKRPGIGREAA